MLLERPLRRRTLAIGAAWTIPAVTVAAPVAYAGVSSCQVSGSVQPGPNVNNVMRAICTAQSQWLHPGTIEANYGIAQLPSYLQICNCQNADSWYRWQEVDTLSEFQIEVDGVHVDQNSSAQGWRASFFLPGFGQTGGCKQFALTYRTSVARPTTATAVSVTFTLQQGSSATGPWSNVTTITVNGSVWRTTSNTVNFGVCSGGGTANRTASAAETEGGGGD